MKTAHPSVELSNESERSQSDSQAPMGYATTRTLERVAAAIGVLESAPIEFESTRDVAAGGVLLAVPALLAQGLLRQRPQSYQLPKGFYGIDSIFLLLALMALTCIGSVEQLRYQAPGEWGKVLGLDRIPEVRTLREKSNGYVRTWDAPWNAQLAKEWSDHHAGQGGDSVGRRRPRRRRRSSSA